MQILCVLYLSVLLANVLKNQTDVCFAQTYINTNIYCDK